MYEIQMYALFEISLQIDSIFRTTAISDDDDDEKKTKEKNKREKNKKGRGGKKIK